MYCTLVFNGEGSGTKGDPFKIPFNVDTEIDGIFKMVSNHGKPDISLFSLGFSNEKVSVELGQLVSANNITVTQSVKFKGLEWFPDEPNKVFVKAIKYGSKAADGYLLYSKTLLDPEHTVEDGWSGNEYWFTTFGNPLEEKPIETFAVTQTVTQSKHNVQFREHFTVSVDVKSDTGHKFVNYGNISEGLAVRRDETDPYKFNVDPFRYGEQHFSINTFVRWDIKDAAAGTPYTDVVLDAYVVSVNVLTIEEYEKLLEVPVVEEPQKDETSVDDAIINNIIEMVQHINTTTEKESVEDFRLELDAINTKLDAVLEILIKRN